MKRELKLLMKEAHALGCESLPNRSHRHTIYSANVSKIRLGKNYQATIETSCNVKERQDQLVLHPVLSHSKEYVDKRVLISCLED